MGGLHHPFLIIIFMFVVIKLFSLILPLLFSLHHLHTIYPFSNSCSNCHVVTCFFPFFLPFLCCSSLALRFSSPCSSSLASSSFFFIILFDQLAPRTHHHHQISPNLGPILPTTHRQSGKTRKKTTTPLLHPSLKPKHCKNRCFFFCGSKEPNDHYTPTTPRKTTTPQKTLF